LLSVKTSAALPYHPTRNISLLVYEGVSRIALGGAAQRSLIQKILMCNRQHGARRICNTKDAPPGLAYLEGQVM